MERSKLTVLALIAVTLGIGLFLQARNAGIAEDRQPFPESETAPPAE